jgi:hypothetical protein
MALILRRRRLVSRAHTVCGDRLVETTPEVNRHQRVVCAPTSSPIFLAARKPCSSVTVGRCSGQRDERDVQSGNAVEVTSIGAPDPPSRGHRGGGDEPVVSSDISPG